MADIADHTYGEFIDVVKAGARVVCLEAPVYIEDWAALASIEEWEDFRPMHLSKGLALNFAEDMATALQERLRGICTSALYEIVTNEGHTFLKLIHAKACEFGVELDMRQVDVPLSPSDAIFMAQVAHD